LKSWCSNWAILIAFFDYPDEIRKATNQRKIFPHDEVVMKVIYLAIEYASKKWSMPLRDWKPVINQFMVIRMPN